MDECFCTGSTLCIKVLQQLGPKVREMSLHTCKLDGELCKRLLLLEEMTATHIYVIVF